MKCLETRRRNGMKWRRYRAPDGHTFTTYELPSAVLLGVTTLARIAKRLEQWHRGQAAAARRAQAEAMLAEGVKPVAIAHELGLSPRTVERYRREARHGR